MRLVNFIVGLSVVLSISIALLVVAALIQAATAEPEVPRIIALGEIEPGVRLYARERCLIVVAELGGMAKGKNAAIGCP